MGEVFEARHEKLERRAAIKFLHPHLCSHPQVVARFLNEARAVNIVRHPSLVDIFELGQADDDGAIYIIMEYLEGETLASRLRERLALPPKEAARIGRQLATALAAAHACGIVHRDLKPDNLMLVSDDEVDGGERLKVLDFGIAKMLGPGGHTPTSSMTRTGFILGTPQYMAPEQCKGSRDVDGKADVYALGVILYEAVCGSPPFAAASEWELFAMHLEQPAPALPPSVPAPYASLVAAMLDKEPSRRPTMAEVVVRLGELRTPSGGELTSPPRPAARTLALPVPSSVVAARATTLGASAAELRARTRSARRAWAPIAVALAAAAAIGGAWMLSRHPSTATLPPPPPPTTSTAPKTTSAPIAPPPARWTITSLPDGASIVRVDTGERLGETPWHREQPRADGVMKVRLALPGYRARELTLDRAGDEHRQIQLRPLPRDPRPTTQGDNDDVQVVH